MPPTFSSLAARGTSGVCTTSRCYNIAETLKSYVNLNVDPCSDFFQYTCGSWLESDTVRNKETSYHTATSVQQKNMDQVLEFLEGSFEELYETIKTDDKSYHTQDKMDIDRKNFHLVKDFYESCIDTESKEAVGATPIFPRIAKIENDLFPYGLNNVADSLAKVLAASTLQGIQTFFKIYLDTNPIDSEYRVMHVRPSALEESVNYDDLDSLLAYKNKLKDMLSNTLGGPVDNIAYESLVAQESQASNFTLWSASKINVAVDSYVNFEMQLYKASNIKEQTSWISTVSNLTSLESSNPTVHWSTFIATLVSKEYVESNPIVRFDPRVVKNIENVLSETDSIILQEYFVIQTTKQHTPYFKTPSSGSGSLEAIKEFRAPSSKDPESVTPRITCVTLVSTKFEEIIGRFFVLKTIGASEAKKKLDDMANMFHYTWLHDMLPKTSWVDNKTKEEIIKKINGLYKKIGYPTDDFIDWRDPSSIESYYKELNHSNKSFYDRMLAINTWENDRNWKSLASKWSISNWFKNDPVFLANARYFPSMNSIEILPGIIQEPFFSADYPEYLNYGSLGAIIGHELVHSLDNNGRLYNASGYIKEWFSKSSAQTFSEKSQCFVDQFANFTVTGRNDEQLNLNGDNILGENISDGGGLSIALNAYRKYILENGGIPEKTLPGFEHFTPEQLFFLSHGISNCEIIPREKAETIVKSHVHAPGYFRTIGTYQNSAEFSKAFNCPVGSPMNPPEKCSIW